MWTSTYHRFDSRAAFLAACAASGWSTPPGGEPDLPPGVIQDAIGALTAAPSLGEAGAPIAGAVIDARYHVNMAWHARDVPAAFAAAQVVPTEPLRRFAGA